MAQAPKVLINTWITLARNRRFEVQESAQRKLLNYFGSVQALAEYMDDNDIEGSIYER